LPVYFVRVALSAVNEIARLNAQTVKQQFPIFHHEIISSARILGRRRQYRANFIGRNEIVNFLELNALAFTQKWKPYFGLVRRRLAVQAAGKRVNVARIVFNPLFTN